MRTIVLVVVPARYKMVEVERTKGLTRQELLLSFIVGESRVELLFQEGR